MIDADTFRKTMRQLASGVVIVTTRLEDRLHATPATAFLPLSAEPPLVLVCMHRDGSTHRAMSQAPYFGVNVLSQSQAALPTRFAGKTLERYLFDDLPRFQGPGGDHLHQGERRTPGSPDPVDHCRWRPHDLRGARDLGSV
jgi:flavin reductase (DIM6/NTAB) family NADH-FMN oxidoreductase RutF